MRQFTIRSALLYVSVIAFSLTLIRYDFSQVGGVGLPGMTGMLILLATLILPVASAVSHDGALLTFAEAVVVSCSDLDIRFASDSRGQHVKSFRHCSATQLEFSDNVIASPPARVARAVQIFGSTRSV